MLLPKKIVTLNGLEHNNRQFKEHYESFQGDDVGGVAAGPREEDEGDRGAQHAERVEDPADVDQAHRPP